MEAVQRRLGFDRVERDDRPRQHEQIYGTLTDYLVGDVDVATLGVASPRSLRHSVRLTPVMTQSSGVAQMCCGLCSFSRRACPRRPNGTLGASASTIRSSTRRRSWISSLPAGGICVHGLATAAGASEPAWRWAARQSMVAGAERRVAARYGRSPGPGVTAHLDFIRRPTARNWYRAHNISIVAGYLANEELAVPERRVERFFINVVLVRVLFAHALVAAPRLALGWLAPLGRPAGDPRIGMTGIFMSLSRVLPDLYPLGDDVDTYVAM